MKTSFLALALVAGGVLSGCGSALQTQYHTPAASMPAQWSGAVDAVSPNRSAWWHAFNDPQLDALIERALASNNDLAVAGWKVRQARLQAGLTDTNLTPTVTVGANGSIEKPLDGGASTRAYGVTGSLSYEIDLWGKLARQRDVTQWEATATELDRQNTALTLVGTTADLYWQIAYLNQRITSTEQSIAYAERTLALVRTQHAAGASSGLDEVQSAQALATQRAGLATLLQQREEARNALAILFDQAPEHRSAELAQLPLGALPAVPAGVPADVLARRPDLQAAEARLRESLANVDYTRASFYPAFTLTGSVGTSSTSLSNVLRDPLGTLGAGLTLPFVQWNTTQLTIKVSQAQYQQAVVSFRQTLYSALADVENTLSARTQYLQEQTQRQLAFDYAVRAEKLSETRYRVGQTGVKDWLDQQEARRTADLSLAENRYNQLLNLMKLYQSVGGQAL
ncbi:efflux transporter outer membrane subunit [Silvimonas sp. JCM 19000]